MKWVKMLSEVHIDLPAPSVIEMALTKYSEIFPALRMPHLMVAPNSGRVDPVNDIALFDLTKKKVEPRLQRNNEYIINNHWVCAFI